MLNRILRVSSTWLLPWLLPLVLVLGWQAAAQLGWLSTRVLPAPLDVLKAGIELGSSGELWHHFVASFKRAFTGLLIGGSLGFILGFFTGLSRFAENLLDSTLQMVRNVPLLALIPLVILWFGIGEEGKVFLVSLAVFFPIYLNTFHGLRSVDKDLIEMGKIYGLGRVALFREVILPGALPSILVGLRLSLGYMWLFLVVAETISSSEGIGYMTMNAREFLQTDVVVLGIAFYALLGKASDVAATQLERHWLKWHKSYRT
ncbi:ABC transporter permease subunit [Ferriphaselus sp. R-1]|uniref:ABC transporter permease subunit n=1 Tax=Ferriphaselus sp. R-1 TaxID=1485544 RepID=UPI000551476E|nr:ABC transporter permease subunit [Ferriphaselus sp. R-1]